RPSPPALHTLSLHDALPISDRRGFFAAHRSATVLLAGLVVDASLLAVVRLPAGATRRRLLVLLGLGVAVLCLPIAGRVVGSGYLDRKSTRLNSSHSQISYAV